MHRNKEIFKISVWYFSTHGGGNDVNNSWATFPVAAAVFRQQLFLVHVLEAQRPCKVSLNTELLLICSNISLTLPFSSPKWLHIGGYAKILVSLSLVLLHTKWISYCGIPANSAFSYSKYLQTYEIRPGCSCGAPWISVSDNKLLNQQKILRVITGVKFQGNIYIPFHRILLLWFLQLVPSIKDANYGDKLIRACCNRTRSNGFKVKEGLFRLCIRKQFFTIRVVVKTGAGCPDRW